MSAGVSIKSTVPSYSNVLQIVALWFLFPEIFKEVPGDILDVLHNPVLGNHYCVIHIMLHSDPVRQSKKLDSIRLEVRVIELLHGPGQD